MLMMGGTADLPSAVLEDTGVKMWCCCGNCSQETSDWRLSSESTVKLSVESKGCAAEAIVEEVTMDVPRTPGGHVVRDTDGRVT